LANKQATAEIDLEVCETEAAFDVSTVVMSFLVNNLLSTKCKKYGQINSSKAEWLTGVNEPAACL
jgi:hypothetical protein